MTRVRRLENLQLLTVAAVRMQKPSRINVARAFKRQAAQHGHSDEE